MSLCSLAKKNLIACVVFCSVSAAKFLLTHLVFWRPPGQERTRRTGAASETAEELAEALRAYIQQVDETGVRQRSSE